MQVWVDLDSEVRGVRRHLELEAETVVQVSNRDTADLSITGNVNIPPECVELKVSGDQVSHFVTRFWKGTGWLEQQIIGLPLVGLMNQNLGAAVPVGCATRFISVEKFSEYFLNPGLVEFLKHSEYSGLVSICLDHNSNVVSVQTQVPYYGIYGILEGVRGKLSDFFKSGTKLFESWAVSLLISRYPFPRDLHFEKVGVAGLTNDVEQHFWSWTDDHFRNVGTTTGTILGVATGWHWSKLSVASLLAQRTADRIQCPGKQYRTDCFEEAARQWKVLGPQVV